MTNNKIRLAAAIVGVAATTALVAGISSASEWGMGMEIGDCFGRDKTINQEVRTEMDQALEDGNYGAWSESVKDRQILSQVTEENFARFAEAHKLMKVGDAEGAQAIFDELGIKKMDQRFGKGQRRGARMEMLVGDEGRRAIMDSIKSNDYSGFKTAVDSFHDKLSNITEEEFTGLVERHEQRPLMNNIQ